MNIQPLLTTICLAFLVSTNLAFAEDKDEEKKEVHPLEKAKEELVEKFEELEKASEKMEGLFDLFQDQRNGKVYFSIKPDQFDKEWIHYAYTIDGIVSLGHFRGNIYQSKVFTIRKRFDEIDFVAENHSFYFDPENAISRASDANISSAVLATAKIIALEEKTGAVLIEADGVFLDEFFRQMKWSSGDDDKKRFQLGDLSKDKTQFSSLKNYPENTAITVEYVFANKRPKVRGEADVTDSRFVSIEVQHTLIEMPENDYQPRLDDPRVGYFLTEVTDLTSTSNTPYRDLINRWHLEPKCEPDENSLAEPKQPIVWWIENTTPVELRETIKISALRWNEAFETAGWKNAVQIKVQPDDADWDAGDIRYNVLRWSSSPNTPFGGYGPRFVNPRTGQILGADIQLEFKFLTNRVRYSKIFSDALQSHHCGDQHCLMNDYLHHGNLFGRTTLKVSGAGSIEVDRLMEDALSRLILHEIGHTLGLGHNFKATMLHDATAVHDKEITGKVGLTASVMDYPALNVPPIGQEAGLYYDVKPGVYDHWAIEYGYSRALDDPKKESKRLEKILARSTEPGLDYANDSDDMRSTGKAIDPRAMIGDMSSEPLKYAKDRMELVRDLVSKLLKESPEEGRSYQTVRDEFSTLMYQYGSQLKVASRYIGGIYVDRAVVGQEGGTQPLTPVSLKKQKQAMGILAKYAFAPDAFKENEELFAHLQTQRRGWDFKSTGEDPKLIEYYLDLQKSALQHILHQNTVTRILNSEFYGNEYSLQQVMDDLTSAILNPSADPNPKTIRQGLQRIYLDKLISISGLPSTSSYPQAAQTEAYRQLLNLNEKLGQAKHVHYRLLQLHIRRALEDKGE